MDKFIWNYILDDRDLLGCELNNAVLLYSIAVDGGWI